MDPKKIGALIYELRNKNHFTQKQLAEQLSVTSQAISKWENGRGIPDIEMLQKLSEIFKVDISELLDGNMKSKENKRKIPNSTLLLFIVWILLLVGAGSAWIFFHQDNNGFQISKLASDNDLFHVKGILAYNNNQKSIYISQVDYSKKEEQKEFLNLECVLYEKNGDTERKISKCDSSINNDSNETFTLAELLKDVELNVDDYSCSCNNLVCNQLYLKINAVNQKAETITYHIPIELESSCEKKN